jgi:hypothetical protein
MTPLRAVPKPRRKKKAPRAWNSTAPVSSAPKVRPPKRKVTKKKSSSTRKAKNWGRAYGSRERVEWVKQQPCTSCGLFRGSCENAHTRTGGAGRKADAVWVIPMCYWCHRNYHIVGKRFFERWAKVDLDAAAAECERKWQEHQAERKSA